MEIKMSDKIKICKITKWLIGVVTACILIYLAIRHLGRIAAGISWLVNIMFPILLGVVMAFILNVPMRPIEKHLHLKHGKAKRPLANKEKLKIQTRRLIHAWLPEKSGVSLIHIVSICNVSFRNFIAGQATEAVILGTLCTIGMLILRLPYAPMVGALVGVTALIPIVGAYIGAIVGAFLILTVSPLKAFIFVIFLIILQQLEGNLIYPRVVGSRVNLPAMWVLAAVTVGGESCRTCRDAARCPRCIRRIRTIERSYRKT